ncbi:MAG: hypothetical protein SGI91_20670 [Alphaproteobacteria bacterium]|jgi:hypothetical protein|nr:hypothetical protein [Alphaproteobacteria bacterium]
MSDGVWRGVFLASAIFNFIVGISLAVDASELAASMGLEVARYDALWSPLVAWFVVMFGVLYLIVWRDLDNKPIVAVGMAGKLGVVVLIALAWSRGLAPFGMVALTLVDLAFAALFALFLFTRRAAA